MAAPTFAARLREAFELRNVGGNMARVALLMRTTGCCKRTGLRWLSGKTAPRHGDDVVRIAAALDVDPSWLAGVANESPLLAACVRRFLSLAPEMQIEAVRLLDRLAIDADRARA